MLSCFPDETARRSVRNAIRFVTYQVTSRPRHCLTVLWSPWHRLPLHAVAGNRSVAWAWKCTRETAAVRIFPVDTHAEDRHWNWVRTSQVTEVIRSNLSHFSGAAVGLDWRKWTGCVRPSLKRRAGRGLVGLRTQSVREKDTLNLKAFHYFSIKTMGQICEGSQ